MEAVAARLEAVFSQLSREPDFDAPELLAHDTADLLIVATAADRLQGAAPGDVVTVGDRHGALTLGAASVCGTRGIRTYQDTLLGERALARNAEALGLASAYDPRPLGDDLFAGAKIVMLQLPRGLEALEELAHAIAKSAHPDVVVFAGGRVKHMTRAQNDVLARYFGEVTAGLGWRKARVLTAASPIRSGSGSAQNAVPPFPKWGSDSELSFKIASFGATFGGPKLDHGSRLLLSTLHDPDTAPSRVLDPATGPKTILDLGSGNGVLAVAAAHAWPHAKIIASDQSDAAVRATALTAEAAGVADRITVMRADGTESLPDESVDLILLNPPFHTGSTVHAGVGQRLIRDCARVLKRGGELRLVFNSHIKYRALVERVIGDSWQLERDKTFTVLAAERR